MDNKQSGFESDPQALNCRDPQHSPPTMLHTPYGMRYRHVCPTCGVEAVLRSNDVTMNSGATA